MSMREQAGQNPARAGEALSIRSARAGTWANTGVADATDVLALEIARLEALWVDHPLRPQLRLAHHFVPPVRKQGLRGPTNGQEMFLVSCSWLCARSDSGLESGGGETAGAQRRVRFVLVLLGKWVVEGPPC